MKSHRSVWIYAITLLTATLGYWGCSDSPTDTNGGDVDSDPPVVSSVTATDYRHVVVVFSEAVDKPTAEHSNNYSFVEATLASTTEANDSRPGLVPGDDLDVDGATLGSDGKTVTLYTSDQADADYNYSISGVKDLSGNEITTAATGTASGSVAPDNTAPTILARSPGVSETGVGIMQAIVVQFSEPVSPGNLVAAFSLTGPGGLVAVEMNQTTSNIYNFQALAALALNTTYTVTITTAITDYDGNNLAANAVWTFTTTSSTDNTPPTVLSTVPADGATNVTVGTDLTVQFSEDVSNSDLERVALSPDLGDGVLSWAANGRSFTFDPDQDMENNTQYTLLIPEGEIFDLAGNVLEESIVVVWTTGAALETGRISGIVSGDATSPEATSPEGAAVLASTDDLFGETDGPPDIHGAAFAAANGSYSITNLDDNDYMIFSLLDSNGDGALDPMMGDALGMWGITPTDEIPDTVTVSGGSHEQNVSFQLYDFSVISGVVSYAGTEYLDGLESYDFHVGVFDTTGFDLGSLGEPAYGSESQSIVWQPQYALGYFWESLDDGVYYVGAYLDVNTGDGEGYNPAVDPAEFYQTGGELAPVTILNGSDGLDINLQLVDPVGGGEFSAWIPKQAAGSEVEKRRKMVLRAFRNAVRNAQNR